jgi:hypothetical protein
MIRLTLEDLEVLVEARIAEASAEKSLATTTKSPLKQHSTPTYSSRAYKNTKQPQPAPISFTNKPFST